VSRAIQLSEGLTRIVAHADAEAKVATPDALALVLPSNNSMEADRMVHRPNMRAGHHRRPNRLGAPARESAPADDEDAALSMATCSPTFVAQQRGSNVTGKQYDKKR
jgi:hypothetical protein